MNESIGTKLRQAREKRQLGFDDAAEATRIRPHYLKALESDDLSVIPSAAQARGFLRIYAEFLGLQVSDLVPAAPPPMPAPAAATSEPGTQPTGKSADVTADSVAQAARSGLVDNVRAFLKRRGASLPKQAPTDAQGGEPASATEAPTNLQDTDKKKLKR